MREFEIIMESNNHNTFTDFLCGLVALGLCKDTAIEQLYYCFSNDNYKRNFKQNNKDCVLQNIFITQEFFDSIMLWFATLNKDVINIYCNEMSTLLNFNYDKQSICQAVKEVAMLMYE